MGETKMGVKSADDRLTCQCVDHVDSETGRRGETGDCCFAQQENETVFQIKGLERLYGA